MDAQAISRLFSRPVSAVVATAASYDEPLLADEYAAVAGAIERRRREFAAGRACARAALCELGVRAAPIPLGSDRAPIWPPGHVGSITHCQGFCCAVVALKSDAAAIGLDAEDAGPLTSAVQRLVLTPTEMASLTPGAGPPGSSWAKLAFSAKEAVYKCLYPLTGVRLDFQDISVVFAADGRFDTRVAGWAAAELRPTPRIDGRWTVAEGLVFTGATAPHERGQWSPAIA